MIRNVGDKNVALQQLWVYAAPQQDSKSTSSGGLEDL